MVILEELFERPEAKAVVFSQWVATHELIARRLERKRWDYALFHGGVPANRRGKLVERFHDDPGCRVFLSTDAGGVGLNLQHAACTVVNMDMPWNPAVLEQRIGRIKRFGQKRDTVDMLNLVNEQTVDEKIYDRLSDRMRDRYDLFGSIPDTIKDEWIDDIEALGQKMDDYIHAQREATGFDLRYTATMEPPERDWRDCTEVLSRRDFAVLMTTAWTA